MADADLDATTVVPSARSRRLKRVLALAGVLLGLLLLVWSAAPLVLAPLGRFLVIQDEPEAVDACIVLSFDPNRIDHAVGLVRRGLVKRAVFMLHSFHHQTFLRKRGIDYASLAKKGIREELHDTKAEILFFEGVSSTFEEATAASALLRTWRAKRVMLVTNAFHMRRARWIFRRVLRDPSIRWLCCPYPLETDEMSLDRWWTRERELLWVHSEYVKLLLYWWKY